MDCFYYVLNVIMFMYRYAGFYVKYMYLIDIYLFDFLFINV